MPSVFHGADGGLADLAGGHRRCGAAEQRDLRLLVPHRVDDELPERALACDQAEDVGQPQHHDVHGALTLEAGDLLLEQPGAGVGVAPVAEVGHRSPISAV